jgi:hypothetical protein
VELDFTALHPVMLYAEKGINYWEEFGTDPYEIEGLYFIADKAESRKVVKKMMMLMLNAKNIDYAT